MKAKFKSTGIDIGSAEYRDLYYRYLESDDWKDKRHLVMLRDNNTCQACFSAQATQVHHKTYDHVFHEPLFDLEAVCDKCHEDIHSSVNVVKLMFKYPDGPMATSDDFEELIKEIKAKKP